MLWARYDVDSQDDGEHNLLRRQFGEGAWERFLRFVEIAKRTNREGKILLASGKPCKSIHLAATHAPWLPIETETENWSRHIKICLELGLLAQSEDEVLSIVDWKRWHIAPSDDSQQTAERQRRSRENRKSRDVTECHEMSRVVTDVTSHSIAEHSKTDQIRVEQTSKQETNFENSPRPAAGQPFVALCEESYRILHPSAGPISRNMLSKAMSEFYDIFKGQHSYKGLIINDSDLCAAWKKGTEGTQKALLGNKPPKFLWAYCIKIANDEIHNMVERRFENDIKKRREKV